MAIVGTDTLAVEAPTGTATLFGPPTSFEGAHISLPRSAAEQNDLPCYFARIEQVPYFIWVSQG
jgi:hypothetical protein